MSDSRTPLIMLAAGGTGGHLFPAQALAETLVQRGFRTQLMTDERVRDYGKNFPAEKAHIVESASPSPKRPLSMLKLYRGYRAAKAILRAEKPLAVVGFGGYPSFPPIYAAASLHIPSVVHEQNAVLGRANKLLSRKVNLVASSFANVMGLPDAAKAKLQFTGNPVRAVALREKGAVFPALGQDFNLVVFGGSQGAKFFSDFMPQVFAAMPDAARRKIVLTQQCRDEDLARVQTAYESVGLRAELKAFFNDMPHRIAGAHLVISRSGASTIAELGVIGRPAIMVPLPHAIDNDQLRNAQSFAEAGAGWVCPQKELEPQSFAALLGRLMADAPRLKKAAESALHHGKPDAAERLADAVEHVIAQSSA
ncbi:MAG: undecaprenyldiphospho-muramoylpentapeptide beta-N-acetylglucosaminyltransferase [Alphaproteobacteria bacterium]|nr:undecaprenyldiphospho-muramoylpentapeptide beta-N-acetylglucosaminyltransferase [Alphaproteobacteria bacterium]